ncbi:MAG: exodeoxyribonuclease VII small subunit, partial [Aeromonas sobria]
QKLELAEQKIQILLSQADGSDKLAPFQPEQGEE